MRHLPRVAAAGVGDPQVHPVPLCTTAALDPGQLPAIGRPAAFGRIEVAFHQHAFLSCRDIDLEQDRAEADLRTHAIELVGQEVDDQGSTVGARIVVGVLGPVHLGGREQPAAVG